LFFFFFTGNNLLDWTPKQKKQKQELTNGITLHYSKRVQKQPEEQEKIITNFSSDPLFEF
jgi:hypothetical protein